VLLEFRGCSFHYRVEGSGEPVVFIQGVGLHGDGWLPQTQQLKSEFRCITFDNRGMGKSQPAGASITVPQMAEDTLAVMDDAGVASAHMVGHSLGGAIALQVALTAPRRVSSLSLLCTSARGSDATNLSAKMMWLGIRTRVGTRRMRAHAFLEVVLPSEYLATHDRDQQAARLAPLLGHPAWQTPPIAMKQLRALSRFDATSRLKELSGIPTLVLSAEHDLIFPPRCGKALVEGIPSARYVEVSGAAHGVPIQCPEIVNQSLTEHLRSARQ
jgi:pimeloyl-ACP methyl ester carboxylesterase